jgi:hypothetical protein
MSSFLFCFLCDSGLLFNIRLGANALNDTNAVTVSADTYFLHPDYDPTTLSNDVGLIRLSNSVAYNGIMLVYYQKINPNNQTNSRKSLAYRFYGLLSAS